MGHQTKQSWQAHCRWYGLIIKVGVGMAPNKATQVSRPKINFAHRLINPNAKVFLQALGFTDSLVVATHRANSNGTEGLQDFK